MAYNGFDFDKETKQAIQQLIRKEMKQSKAPQQAPPKPPPKRNKADARKVVDLCAFLLTAGATFTPLIIALLLFAKH